MSSNKLLYASIVVFVIFSSVSISWILFQKSPPPDFGISEKSDHYYFVNSEFSRSKFLYSIKYHINNNDYTSIGHQLSAIQLDGRIPEEDYDYILNWIISDSNLDKHSDLVKSLAEIKSVRDRYREELLRNDDDFGGSGSNTGKEDAIGQ